MTRARVNLLIDAVMAVLMAAIAGLGFLMNWVLIPGEERPAVYGSRPDLYWLGLDRHQWGDVHLVLGISLLVLLVLHVVLHWSQVVGIWRRMVASGSARVALALALLALIVALMAFPVFVKPEVVEGGHGEGGGHGRGAAFSQRGTGMAEGGEVGNRKPEIENNGETANGPTGRGRRGGRGMGGGGRGMGRNEP